MAGRGRIRGFLPFRHNRLGQSAAIGTILAILVLLTILTVVTTRWIPVWTEGREADHAAVIDAQFADLKRTIDQQALFGVPGQGVGNPITLGQPGVPIFAPGSSGTLNLGAYGPTLRANILTIENSSGAFNQSAYGAIKYTTLNTRYIQQSHLYEFGAVLLNQTDGQLMTTGPSMKVENVSGKIWLTMTLISMSGDGTSFTGDNTIGVRTQLAFAPAVTEINFTTAQTFWINVTSESPGAWWGYLNQTLSQRLVPSQYNLTYAPSLDFVSARLDNVERIAISYQVFQADLDIA